MKKLISTILVLALALSLAAFSALAEEEYWAYGVTIEGVGTIYYACDYFAIDGIVNPLTAEPYTGEEIAAIVDGAAEGAEGYTFDVPEGAFLGMNGFWYDAANTAAITSHADPLTMNDAGVFSTADGIEVATPIVE